MISKINRLHGFGNFRQFQWGSNATFVKRNLIYGWNYSGKTTLSRLFQLLSDSTLVSQWQGCTFEVELSDGTKLTHANLSSHSNIKVFNRDFIQSNFQQEHKAPAVFMVGGTTIHLRSRIARLNQHQQRVDKVKSNLDASYARFRRELEAAGTTRASAVATLTGDKTYNRIKLSADVARVRASPETFLLDDASLQAKITLVRSTTEWGEIRTVFKPTVDLERLGSKLEVVVQKTASNIAIETLKKNHSLEAWVRAGLAHHEKLGNCQFCGSEIPEDRLQLLQNHFSRAYEDLVSEVSSLLATLEAAKTQILLPDERDFIPDLKGKFLNLKGHLDDWTTWANAVIAELKALAKGKTTSIETQIKSAVDTSRSSEIDQFIVDINAVIAEHNNRRQQIASEKLAAKLKVENHHAALFYQSENIADREAAIDEAGARVQKAQSLLGIIASKKAAIEARIQQQSIAAQKINETIQFLLPDNSITVIEIPGGYFEFRRDATPANNLSDGEKTAITFAYFLATLENNGASLNQAIVFIDDPISSLDSNHIYAIYALVTKRLESCLQVFVSTHNSELYALLKDAWFEARSQFSNRRDSSAYYMRRHLDADQHWSSSLEDMPTLLRKYKSEYQFVFEQLHKFANSNGPSLHEAYTAPNLLRKLLEAYLGFKKPCVSKWSDKLDLLFDVDVERTEIQKFSDDASHLQGLNRALQQPNFITNAQGTVSKVIQALKAKDLPHYTSMCTVIGVAP